MADAALTRQTAGDEGGMDYLQRMLGGLFPGEGFPGTPENRDIPPDDRPSRPKNDPDQPAGS